MLDQHRLLISFSRVTSRKADGTPATHVRESVNLVHPDDAGQQKSKSGKMLNGFRELGGMFKGNADYFDVTYDKLETVV